MDSISSSMEFTKEDQLLERNQRNQRPDQNDEIPANLLSGDEAMEKSFSVGSMYMGSNKKVKANIPLSSIIVSKSILGVGILGLPYVTKQFGLLITVIIIFIVYFQTQYATNMLLKCKNLSKRSNYSTIGLSIFKTKFILVFINVIIILNNFGLCFAEMIIQATAADNLMNQFSDGEHWYKHKYLYTIISACIMMPMMVIQKIEKLKHAGLVALLSMTVFTITIVVSFIITVKDGELPDEFQLFPTNFQISKAFGAFPTLLLAYNWQFNLFPVYKGMQVPSDHNLMTVSYTGMSISTLFYLIVGIFGFGLYGNETDPNFLKKASIERLGKSAFIMLNLAFYISTVLTTPLVFHGARNNFLALIKVERRKKKQVDVEELSVDELRQLKRQRQRNEQIRFYVWSIGLFSLIAIGAMLIDQLEVAFNIVGSISSNSIGCLLPSLFYVKLVSEKFRGFVLKPFEQLQLYFAKGFFVYSVIISMICLISEFYNQINK